MVSAYKWGGIAFDDYSLSKVLILPSNAYNGNEVTFHAENGSNYRVPSGKVFIVGYWFYDIWTALTTLGLVGESTSVDNALTKIVIRRYSGKGYADIMAVFTALKYVTAATTSATNPIEAGTTLFGVEVAA
ncbi:unnamed protein product [marine sediment metagenome]|uniref:Uncharacterized protein n=1 Tax=marine sediment metagenome TaxID=412755 RepID=X1T955_9ZZZZ